MGVADMEDKERAFIHDIMVCGKSSPGSSGGIQWGGGTMVCSHSLSRVEGLEMGEAWGRGGRGC